MSGQSPWDGGKPVAARGRFYIPCAANVVTTLTQDANKGGAAGDELDWVWLFPTSTTPGAASIIDGTGGGAVTVWPWPAGITLADKRPIFVPLNLRSAVGAWSVSLPATFTGLAAGRFT